MEKTLFWVVRLGAWSLPFTLLIISYSLFFPFVSGKNFAFRVIVELMAAAWGGLLLFDFQKYWPRRSLIGTTFAVFIGLIFLTSLFGVDFHFSFWSNFERMEGIVTYLHLLLLFLVLAGVFRARKEWFILFGVSIFASFLVAFYGMLETTGEVQSFSGGARIISTLGNPLYVAAYLTFGIFLAAFLWREIKSPAWRRFLAGVVVFEAAVFFLTGARGAFVGILAGLGIAASLFFLGERGLKRKLALGGAILFLAALPVGLYVFREADFIRTNQVLARFSNLTPEAGEARILLWGMAIEASKERPILGWGAGNFDVPFAKHYDPRMLEQEPWFDRTHNMPLEWLVSGGVLVFGAYLALWGSAVWALRRAVRRGLLDRGAAFIFTGMLAAYLIQLLFVFDTLATFLMSAFFLAFLHWTSVTGSDARSQENQNLVPERSRRTKFLSLRQAQGVKNSLHKGLGVIAVFVFTAVLIYAVNIRPLLANRSLMRALIVFNDKKFSEAQELFQTSLRLSKRTIGTDEIREHLVFNTYKLFQYPEYLKTPEGEAFYRFSLEEMEKQIAENSSDYPKIKHNLLLAQLYHQRARFTGADTLLESARSEYGKVIEFAPNYVNAYSVFANAVAESGDPAVATWLIERAYEILKRAGKYDNEVFYTRALFYAAQGRYNEAYEVLEAIYRERGGLEPEFMKNIIAVTQDDGAAALPFLERVNALDGRLPFASLTLAQIYVELRDRGPVMSCQQESDFTLLIRQDTTGQTLSVS